MNIRFQPRRHVIDLLFTLALFCVFAASALLVVLIGADVYESSARGMDRNFDLQTSLHYVAAKVRQCDAAGAVHAGELGGAPALIIEQEFGGEVYRTYLYAWEGSLCELFTVMDDPSPVDGTPITKVPAFEVEQVNPRLLRVSCPDADGRDAQLYLSLRSGKEGSA